MRVKQHIDRFRALLKPYREILRFMLIVILVHIIWKVSFSASDDDSFITFLTLNVSKPFIYISNHFTSVTQYIINNILGIETFRYNQQLYFDNSPGISIVWACSGVKQYLMMVFVILFASGSWLKKLWYIPLSILGMYVLNVFRLVILTLVTRFHIEWFDFTHKVIFRVIIYGGLFLFWWLWVERITKNPPSRLNVTPPLRKEDNPAS
ncbi:archaeosortase/exosortase family protein [Saccharicrinis sp. FJH62]|uniref:archaeosortase/exosortase family protein n=1 Tax=Saccharicrinis sp. FJH62 TaxID=3344657 RepID=UPI0035D3E170